MAPKYSNAGNFNDFGLAKVGLDGRYGFIDKNAPVVIDIIYDQTDPFQSFLDAGYDFMGGRRNTRYSEGLIPVRKKWKRDYVDGYGNLVIHLEYDEANSFGNGRATV